MSNNIQSPRGTRDILPEHQAVWIFIANMAKETANILNFQPITTPTYEDKQLFLRSIGTGTDVIDKELFLVKGVRSEDQDQYALRPEGTAGIVRAFIEHGMHTRPQPVKLFSLVNNFRYDRPQKGRYREHTQFDLEYFGDKTAFADAWIIYSNWLFFQKIGLKNTSLKLNSLGTKLERDAYIEKLTNYLSPHQEKLSPDSQIRLKINPLRILDSKEEKDQNLLKEAPKLLESLSPESLSHFNEVCDYLKAWEIPYTIDHYLVRGLDYYCHTAFEWVLASVDGQQNSLGGGGRYDGLLTQLGGMDIGAVGAGLGMDRVVEEWLNQNPQNNIHLEPPTVFIISTDKVYLAQLTVLLTQNNIKIESGNPQNSIVNQLKKANKLKAQFAIIAGPSEIESQTVNLKNLSNSQQETISINSLIEKITQIS